jgi:cell division protein FtsB
MTIDERIEKLTASADKKLDSIKNLKADVKKINAKIKLLNDEKHSEDIKRLESVMAANGKTIDEVVKLIDRGTTVTPKAE